MCAQFECTKRFFLQLSALTPATRTSSDRGAGPGGDRAAPLAALGRRDKLPPRLRGTKRRGEAVGRCRRAPSALGSAPQERPKGPSLPWDGGVSQESAKAKGLPRAQALAAGGAELPTETPIHWGSGPTRSADRRRGAEESRQTGIDRLLISTYTQNQTVKQHPERGAVAVQPFSIAAFPCFSPAVWFLPKLGSAREQGA